MNERHLAYSNPRPAPFLTNTPQITVTLQGMIYDASQTIVITNPPADLADLDNYVRSLEDLDVAEPFYIASIS